MSDPISAMRIAIIGASLTGARAAETLRRCGFTGHVMMIGEEMLRPYERPALSKEALFDGAVTPQWVHGDTFYADQDIELITGCAVAKLTAGKSSRFDVGLSDGRNFVADTVLLATGGRPRMLPGCPVGGPVNYVRTWDDSVRLRESLRAGVRVVVIGTGFIGAEVASSALARGCRVTLVEALPRLFPSLPSRAIAEEMARRFADAGAAAYVGRPVERVVRHGAEVQVHFVDGSIVETDLVVAGIGIEMRTELAVMAGAEVGRGVVVDQQCRSSVPGLFAAGDVCTVRDDSGNECHVEHWKWAQEQGVVAAYAMLSLPAPAMSLPWCWSDQLGQHIETAGKPLASDEQVIRRSGTELCVFHIRGGQLVGVVSLNAMRTTRMTMRLIESAARPDPAQLADPAISLNRIGNRT